MPQQLEPLEDPLVCSTCGDNDFTILDRETEKIRCHNCGKNTELLDKSLIPEQNLVTGLRQSINDKPSIQQIYQKWKEGIEPTERQRKILKETRYSYIWYIKHKKNTSQRIKETKTDNLETIQSWMDYMEVD